MNIYILFIILIAFINFLGVGKSLSFGLNGDDWQALYFYINRFSTLQSHFNINNFSTDVSNYTFAHILMGIIYRLFSFNPFPYYFVSLIFRITTAISFYHAIHAVTKNKLAGFLSTLLFSVMFIGIQTSNWVFNMNTYLSIILFNLFIYLYTKKDSLNIIVKNLILGIILGLSFIITPNRMHGLLFAIPFIALIKIEKINIYNIRLFFLKILFFYFPILGFRFLLRSTNDVTYTPAIVNSLTKINFIPSILGSLGNSLLPEDLYKMLGISQNGKTYFAFFILLFIGILFYWHLKSSSRLSKIALLSLSLIISFTLMPLLIFGPAVLPSEHRYLTIPGAYIMVIYAALFSILWKSKKQTLIIPALLLIGIVSLSNFSSLNSYFNNLSNKGRLAIDSQKQFNYLISQINRPQNNAPVVLLFIPDDPHYLYNAITFGLPYHLMLKDKRMGLEMQKAPFATDNLESLINVLSNKESSELKRYGYKPIKIPLENVFVFTLQNKTLTNITPQARNELKKLIPGL